mgnify:CR=1 FL=1
MFSISPSQVRGLDPETILKYLQTDYTPLYNSMRDANTMRQFYDTQRYNEEKDARSLKFDREKEARLAENDAFTKNQSQQKLDMDKQDWERENSPYSIDELNGMFKMAVGRDPEEGMLTPFTKMRRNEVRPFMQTILQAAKNGETDKKIAAGFEKLEASIKARQAVVETQEAGKGVRQGNRQSWQSGESALNRQNAANIANIIASGKEEVFGHRQQQDIDDRIMEHAKLILRQNAEEINADTERMRALGMQGLSRIKRITPAEAIALGRNQVGQDANAIGNIPLQGTPAWQFNKPASQSQPTKPTKKNIDSFFP